MKYAFDGQSLMGLMIKICQGDIPPIPDRYDSELKALTATLLNRDPQQRPSASEVLKSDIVELHIKKMKFLLSKHSTDSIKRDREVDLSPLLNFVYLFLSCRVV